MLAQTIVLLLNDNSWILDNPWGRAYGCNPKSVAVYPYTYDVAYGQQTYQPNIKVMFNQVNQH